MSEDEKVTEATFSVGQRVWFGQHGTRLFAATVVAVPRTWTEKPERTPIVYDGDEHVSFALTECLHAE
jgi:hypothetical protein